MGKKKTVRLLVATGAVVVVGACAYFFGPLVGFAARTGYLAPTKERTYKGDSEANLKAIQIAIQSYYESEGQYPDATGWMDEAFNRMKTADMKDEETKKKLEGPAGGDGGYGYAFNDRVSQKIKRELGDPGVTVLVYESGDTAWDAHGDPMEEAKKNPRAKAVMLDGTVKTLADLPKTAKAPGP